MNTSCRPTDVMSPPHSVIAPQDVRSPTELQPNIVVWVDLSGADRLTLDAAQKRYGLPPEAMTYFLLHYQSPKLIHAKSALFLVTFLATPSLRHLFTLRELKICMTPTHVVTWCESLGRTRSEPEQTPLFMPSLDTGGAGRFLCGLLAGVVESYACIVTTVKEQFREGTSQEARERWRRRVEKFIHCLHDEHIFLQNMVREGRKLFADEEGRRLQQLVERVTTLAQVTSEALHP